MRPGWARTTIGEVCRIFNGGTPKTSVPEYWDGNHRWITPAEMGKRATPYIGESARTLTAAGLNNSSAQLLPPNSLILSSRAPIGYVVINTEPMAFNQGCKGLVPDARLHYKFLYYFLTSAVDLLNDLGTGATFKELSAGKLKSVELPLPPLVEQKRIVAILDEAFTGIDAAVANAEKNLANARELFESYQESVFARKGAEWTVRRVGDLGRVQTGTTPKTSESENYGGSIPFIKPGDFLRNGSLEYENFCLSALGAGKGRLIASGSVLMVCIGATIGKTSVAEREVSANQQINALTPERGVSPRFVYHQMNTRSFQMAVRAAAGQATLPIINKSKWSNLLLHIPPEAEQVAIASRLDSIWNAINNLEVNLQRRLDALAELKQSILQKAFAGELTAKEAEREMAAA